MTTCFFFSCISLSQFINYSPSLGPLPLYFVFLILLEFSHPFYSTIKPNLNPSRPRFSNTSLPCFIHIMYCFFYLSTLKLSLRCFFSLFSVFSLFILYLILVCYLWFLFLISCFLKIISPSFVLQFIARML